MAEAGRRGDESVLFDRTDEAQIAIKIGSKMVEHNTKSVVQSGRETASALSEFAEELDHAAERAEVAAKKFSGSVAGLVADARAKRMAIAGEVREVMSSLRDFNDFTKELAPALASMKELVAVGEQLRSLYGESGLDRLAEALLVASSK